VQSACCGPTSDIQDWREVTYAKNLLELAGSCLCLVGIADDLAQRMRQNKKCVSLAPISGEAAD
jgi:hypothetical protein